MLTLTAKKPLPWLKTILFKQTFIKKEKLSTGIRGEFFLNLLKRIIPS